MFTFRPHYCTRLRRSRRGSLLVVALLLAAGIGISLVSYLQLSTTSLRLSDRSFQGVAGINLAETGLEQALYAVNRNRCQGVPLAAAWSGWTTDTGAHTAKRRFPASGSYDLGAGARGFVKVHVHNFDSTGTPVIVAQADVSGADGSAAVSKFLEVQLALRSLWAYGVVCKTSVVMNATARVDSWISDPDGSAATAAVGYSSGLMRDRGSVGVVSGADGAITMSTSSEIYGTANTGGGNVTTDTNVRIYGATSPSSPKVDPTRIHKDFAFTFPEITVPPSSTVNFVTASWTNNMSLPRVGDVADGGVYYYVFAAGNNIALASSRTITVNQPVVFILQNHQGVPAFTMASFAALSVTPGKNVAIYTNGNVVLTSMNEINVGNEAKNFFLYGTSLTGQTFDFDSNVQFYGCIYAPNAAIRLNSNTDVYGSMIGNTVQMDSNSEVHYDESLANVGGPGGMRVNRWKELRSAAERQVYESHLGF